MSTLIIRITNLSGTHQKIDFSKLTEANLAIVKKNFFSNDKLTLEQEKELQQIIVTFTFYQRIKLKISGAIFDSQRHCVEVVIEIKETERNHFNFVDPALLADLLRGPAEISFDGPHFLDEIIDIVMRAQQVVSYQSQLSRLEVVNVEPTPTQLFNLFTLPVLGNRSIIFTQAIRSSQAAGSFSMVYHVEINVTSAVRETFSVHFINPFIGSLTLPQIMALAPEHGQSRVSIDLVSVVADQVCSLQEAISVNGISILKKSGENWYFSCKPVNVGQTGKLVMQIDQALDDDSKSFMNKVKPQSLVFNKETFTALSLVEDYICELTLTDVSFDDQLFGHFSEIILQLPNLTGLHFKKVVFTDQNQKEILMKKLLPRKLETLTFVECGLNKRDSELLADFLRLHNSSLRQLTVMGTDGFQMVNLSSVIEATNNALTDLTNDQETTDQILQGALIRNRKFQSFVEIKIDYNRAVRRFYESIPPQGNPSIQQFILILKVFFTTFEALMQSFRDVSAYPSNPFVNGSSFPTAEQRQKVKESLCQHLENCFKGYLQKEVDPALIKDLYDNILHFMKSAGQPETKLVSVYFATVEIGMKNCEFAYSLLQRLKSTYKTFNSESITAKFYKDSLKTFSHSKDNVPREEWWLILERLCSTELNELTNGVKKDFLRRFTALTFENYILPQLKQQSDAFHIVRNEIKPEVIEAIIKGDDESKVITLEGLHALLLSLRKSNYVLAFLPGSSHSDDTVGILLKYLNGVMPQFPSLFTAPELNSS